jgi:hypothetical protein
MVIGSAPLPAIRIAYQTVLWYIWYIGSRLVEWHLRLLPIQSRHPLVRILRTTIPISCVFNNLIQSVNNSLVRNSLRHAFVPSFPGIALRECQRAQLHLGLSCSRLNAYDSAQRKQGVFVNGVDQGLYKGIRTPAYNAAPNAGGYANSPVYAPLSITTTSLKPLTTPSHPSSLSPTPPNRPR